MDWDSFFEVHKDLPREGPGSASEVAWALDLAGVAPEASICDAGAGPGDDSAALLAHQGARVVAVDKTEAFVAQARVRFAAEPRFRAEQCDMAEIATLPEAPFDFVWCAGALYFLGIEAGLEAFGRALKPGGAVAFSEPCYFADPSAEAVAFWDGYETQDASAILSQVRAAGYEVLGHRKVSDEAWEAYFQPMEARIAMLRAGAGPALTEMLDLCAAEAAQWRAVREDTGYLLVVARKTGAGA